MVCWWFDKLTMSDFIIGSHHERILSLTLTMSGFYHWLSPLILSLSKDGMPVVRQAHHERTLFLTPARPLSRRVLSLTRAAV